MPLQKAKKFVHYILSAGRFRECLGTPGVWRLWVIVAAILAGLGAASHFSAIAYDPDIEATLHREGMPSEGVPVNLGEKVRLNPNEAVFYSLEFKPRGENLQLDIVGAVSRILLNGREVPGENIKIFLTGGDQSRFKIDFDASKKDPVRLDLWLMAWDGVVEVKTFDPARDVFARLPRLFYIGGGIAFLIAVFGINNWRIALLVGDAFRSRAWLRSIAWGVVGMALAAIFQATLLRPYEVRVQVGNEAPVQVPLPHNGRAKMDEVCIYRGVFQHGILTNNEVQVIPDDYLLSLNVNGREVDLSHIPNEKLRDWSNGFTVSLRPYVVPGRNTFEVAVVNTSNPYGLRLRTSADSAYYLSGFALLGIVACVFLGSLSSWLKLGRKTMGLLFGAVVLRLVYLSYTGPYDRAYDVSGHLDHMNYILANQSLPSNVACWECHQPTFYYLIGGAGLLTAQKIGLGTPVAILPLVSIFFDWIFLIAGACLFKLIVPRYAVACCALLFYWPSGVMNSVRINNDLPFYAFCVVSLLFAMRWARDGKTRDMLFSALAAALVVVTKMTGLSLLPILFFIWLTKAWRGKSWSGGILAWQTFIAAAIIGVGLSVLYLDKLQDRWNLAAGEQIAPVVGSLSPALAVGNQLRNYYLFDLRDFLEEPYASPWEDRGGRQYFFTYFWKTSLFGEFRHTSPDSQVYLAHALKVALLVLLTACGIGLLGISRLRADVVALCLGLMIFPMAGLFLFRYHVPFACNQDFRYVYPITLSVIILAANGCDLLARSCTRKWNYFFWILTLAWVLMASAFFILPRTM